MGILFAAFIWAPLLLAALLLVAYLRRSRSRDPLGQAEEALAGPGWRDNMPARRFLHEGEASGTAIPADGDVEAAIKAVGKAADFGGGFGNGLA